MFLTSLFADAIAAVGTLHDSGPPGLGNRVYLKYCSSAIFTDYNESTEVQTLGVIRIQL